MECKRAVLAATLTTDKSCGNPAGFAAARTENLGPYIRDNAFLGTAERITITKPCTSYTSCYCGLHCLQGAAAALAGTLAPGQATWTPCIGDEGVRYLSMPEVQVRRPARSRPVSHFLAWKSLRVHGRPWLTVHSAVRLPCC